jgi:hypothetical protein
MYDTPPAPPTTAESSADPPRASEGERRESDGDPAASGPVPPRSRTGVDPPDGRADNETRGGDGRDDRTPALDERDADADDPVPDERDADADDCDDPDEESLAYRLERLRLWRTLATLAVVVARLIRSL